MTQIVYRTRGGKGLSQAAWKYLMRREIGLSGYRAMWANREKRKAEAKKNITLPKLKWMERDTM